MATFGFFQSLWQLMWILGTFQSILGRSKRVSCGTGTSISCVGSVEVYILYSQSDEQILNEFHAIHVFIVLL